MEAEGSKATVSIGYRGEGWTLFGLYLVNVLLSILTLGIYSFWGKARILRYLYEQAELAGSELAFHGTGAELFKAFLRLLVVLAAMLAVVLGLVIAIIALRWDMTGAQASMLSMALTYAAMAFLVPIAINSRLRYRMSRTSWRGIRLGYTGRNKEYLPLFLKGLALSILSLGVYASWFYVRLRRYELGHTRFGALRFSFEGEGRELFRINARGLFLTVISLGMYGFFWAADVYSFTIGKVVVSQGERRARLAADTSAGRIFRLVVPNLFLAILSLGLATPWIIIRKYRFVFGMIKVDGELDPDSVEPDPGSAQDAIGESMADFLNLGDFGIV
jgi:uncharacterized membrane protein YjgN (DUF898 family)